MHQVGQHIAPSILLPVRRSIQPPSTVWSFHDVSTVQTESGDGGRTDGRPGFFHALSVAVRRGRSASLSTKENAVRPSVLLSDHLSEDVRDLLKCFGETAEESCPQKPGSSSSSSSSSSCFTSETRVVNPTSTNTIRNCRGLFNLNSHRNFNRSSVSNAPHIFEDAEGIGVAFTQGFAFCWGCGGGGGRCLLLHKCSAVPGGPRSQSLSPQRIIQDSKRAKRIGRR